MELASGHGHMNLGKPFECPKLDVFICEIRVVRAPVAQFRERVDVARRKIKMKYRWTIDIAKRSAVGCDHRSRVEKPERVITYKLDPNKRRAPPTHSLIRLPT